MASVLQLVLALLRALPALESLVRKALEARDNELKREAAARQVAKDAAVDAAIDAPLTPKETVQVAQDIQAQAGE